MCLLSLELKRLTHLELMRHVHHYLTALYSMLVHLGNLEQEQGEDSTELG